VPACTPLLNHDTPAVKLQSYSLHLSYLALHSVQPFGSCPVRYVSHKAAVGLELSRIKVVAVEYRSPALLTLTRFQSLLSLHIRGLFNHSSYYAVAGFITVGFTYHRAGKPLRVELFSFTVSRYASPAALEFYPFGVAPPGGFSPLLTYQARYRIVGSSALFPGRPYSSVKAYWVEACISADSSHHSYASTFPRT